MPPPPPRTFNIVYNYSSQQHTFADSYGMMMLIFNIKSSLISFCEGRISKMAHMSTRGPRMSSLSSGENKEFWV